MNLAHTRLVDPREPRLPRSLADEWVYRYTDREGLLKWFAASGELRMNAWSAMNDPRETKAWTVTGPWSATGALTRHDVERRVDEIARRSARLLSTTREREPESEDRRALLMHRGWANAPMWQHYAKGYAGACIVFDMAELHANLGTIVGASGQRRGMGWIDYHDRPAEIALEGEFASETDVDLAVETYLDSHGNHLPLHFQKSVNWAYENEARLFSIVLEASPADFDQPLDKLPARSALQAVILGDAHDDPRASAAQLRAGLGDDLEVLQCRWPGGHPILEAL
ncbi:MAG: hypothetical protein JWN04_4663 [Myxococcaceae bacterium]|nr:hypothetical protein [Myxococcaceae bacterium]